VNNIKETIRQINGSISSLKERKGVIAFTSLSSSLAQRTVVANLAIMYGRASLKTIILDTDFNQNSFPEAFHISNSLGLSNYLNDSNINIFKIINNLPNQNMAVISSGTVKSTETSYLVNDPKFGSLIDNLSKEYDLILINGAPVKSYDEAQNVYKNSDGVVIISENGRTPKKALFKLFRHLRNDKIRILGYINAER